MSVKKNFPKPRKPVLKSGIVFYVYSSNQCHNKSIYMDQVKINARFIKETDHSINIALMTNCDIPVETMALKYDETPGTAASNSGEP